jgi:hypothetical protein
MDVEEKMMVQASPKPRKRVTKAEALKQARAQIWAKKVLPKPRPARDEDSPRPRDRDRWFILPKHLAAYAGELGVISQGHIWTYRVDRQRVGSTATESSTTRSRAYTLDQSMVLIQTTSVKIMDRGNRPLKGTKPLAGCGKMGSLMEHQ